MDPLYVLVGQKFIPMLEKHFPDILDEILNCNNQRFSPTNSEEFTTSFRHSHTKHRTNTEPHLVLDICHQEIEIESNETAAFATAHHRYVTIVITIL